MDLLDGKRNTAWAMMVKWVLKHILEEDRKIKP